MLNDEEDRYSSRRGRKQPGMSGIAKGISEK